MLCAMAQAVGMFLYSAFVTGVFLGLYPFLKIFRTAREKVCAIVAYAALSAILGLAVGGIALVI
jgi:hypothetical protein